MARTGKATVVEKEGILRKRVNYFRVYQEFYVVLRDGRLDLLNKKTRELYSSIVLSGTFTVSELSKPHRKSSHHGKPSEACAFSILNGENLLARFMADSTEEATDWKLSVEMAIRMEQKRPRSKSMRRKRSERRGDQPSYIAEKLEIAQKVQFSPIDSVAGMTLYRETNMTRKNLLLKVGCIVNAGVDEVFRMLLHDRVNFEPWDEWEERSEILEEQAEKHLRVEHVRWCPVKVMGVWTKPRDFVLQRYWMSFENGSKLITWRSCEHPDAPVDPNFVRGNIWMSGFLITPKKRGSFGSSSTLNASSAVPAAEEEDQSDNTSCWVDYSIHFSPEGWLGSMPLSMHQQWVTPLMQRLALLREAVDRRNYLDIDYAYVFKRLQSGGGSATAAAQGRAQLPRQASARAAELLAAKTKAVVAPAVATIKEAAPHTTTSSSSLSSASSAGGKGAHASDTAAGAGGRGGRTPEAGGAADENTAPVSAEGLAGTFPCWEDTPLEKEPLKVRGANYLKDKVKQKSGAAAFRVVAVDLFETEGRVTHIASRPDNLVHRLVKEAGFPFIFMVHFTLPGPPFYSLVVYFAAQEKDLNVGNPFGDLLNKFLNSESSEFRDNCFKLIPRVVEGNFFVSKAVGTTPAILGKKLDQEYYGDGETYFELVVDVGSSAVAGSILGVVKGYAASISIDLAFLLEGQEAQYLPERILGSIRLIKPDMDMCVKLPFYAVPASDDEEDGLLSD
ncbi:Protein ENHANCED DISEASE RESISTANCE 2 [Hondaea fermentalgiana]|uniref:Protein ENHANCED DISEASE RESISTANCE 2 n=1 Tax=Hondaea fermentalgiana TaxID=2315210 RepID=A0A2R5G6W9_9STRA|nr:Protein ENHANCED DISEASE RESISTANCE 2 [Hondaea fermentalgiana]|eukprot:GBG24203.1 Protein ENHANCED DISEASE RESISTANCE 2 [Hondaea fermentalgiana]